MLLGRFYCLYCCVILCMFVARYLLSLLFVAIMYVLIFVLLSFFMFLRMLLVIHTFPTLISPVSLYSNFFSSMYIVFWCFICVIFECGLGSSVFYLIVVYLSSFSLFFLNLLLFSFFFFFFMIRQPPRSTFFPYTTLFWSIFMAFSVLLGYLLFLLLLVCLP